MKDARRELLKYVKENRAKGYSMESIKSALYLAGYQEDLVDSIVHSYDQENRNKVFSVLAVFLMLGLGLFMLVPTPTGLITVTQETSYDDDLNLSYNTSSSYSWVMSEAGLLKSMRLDGTLSKGATGRVLLVSENNTWVIFDSDRLSEEGIGSVTGLVVANTTNSSNRSITVGLSGGGVVSEDGFFTITPAATFDWDVNPSALCTAWNIDNVTVCHGASDCCNLVGSSSVDSWNSSLYLTYGRYGADSSNSVSAQVVFANYSLAVENPYSEIIVSESVSVGADFTEERINFSDLCIETCLLNLNASTYTLVVEIDNGSIDIESVTYAVENEVNISANAPELVSDLANITIFMNEEYVLNLSPYYTDDEELNYSFYGTNDLEYSIEGSVVTIEPTLNYTGTVYAFVAAYDGTYNTSSNVFTIEVVERPLIGEEVNKTVEEVKPSVVINRPVKWVKRVSVNDTVLNLTVNISNDALNVTVKDLVTSEIISESKIKVSDDGIIKNATTYKAEKRVEQIEKVVAKLEEEKTDVIRERPTAQSEITAINKELIDLENEKNDLTGYAIVEVGDGIISRLLAWIFDPGVTGAAIVNLTDNNSVNSTAVIIEDIVNDVEIEYYTEAPISEEENLSRGKRIVISSDVHYENILAYTQVDNLPSEGMTLYHIVNGSRNVVSFTPYDLDSDGLTDYIEWIVPHLSNQTYELELNILNVQSYPTVGGFWEVRFTTAGVANLSIAASNGTTWGGDLDFVSLKCGDDDVSAVFNGTHVVYENWGCNETGYHRVRVLTDGVHTQEFKFGNLTAYANNYAGALPSTISLQGKLTNKSNSLINQTLNFTFRIYDAYTGGTHLWEENQTLNVTEGIYNAILGSINPIDLDMQQQLYVGIIVDWEDEMVPRLNLTSTPYTYRARVAENVSCTDCLGEDQIEDVFVLNTGDTASGNYTFGSSTFFIDGTNDFVGINITTPSSTLHVVGSFNLTADTRRIYENNTCVVIEGPTSELVIC